MKRSCDMAQLVVVSGVEMLYIWSMSLAFPIARGLLEIVKLHCCLYLVKMSCKVPWWKCQEPLASKQRICALRWCVVHSLPLLEWRRYDMFSQLKCALLYGKCRSDCFIATFGVKSDRESVRALEHLSRLRVRFCDNRSRVVRLSNGWPLQEGVTMITCLVGI